MTTPQERLRSVLTEAEALSAKGVMSTEESTSLAELLTEGRSLKSQIEQNTSLAELSGFAGASAAPPPPLASGGNKAQVETITDAGTTTIARDTSGLKMLSQYGEGIYDVDTMGFSATPDYRDAFKAYIRKGAAGIKSGELKTLQEGADQSGGFLVPSDVLDRVLSRDPTPTRVAARVTQLQTSRDNLVIPKINYNSDDLYTTGMRITWTGEIPSSSTAMRVTEPVFGQTNVPVATAMMSIPVTNDMVEDASFPLVSYVSGKFAETIDLLKDNMILNGTGQGQPAGILVAPGGTDSTSSPAIVDSKSASTLTADQLIALGFALPEQYDMNAAFVMNKTSTAATIAELKDGQQRYIWGNGFQDSGLSVNIHDRALLGYPVVLSGFMPNVGAGTFPIIFGDLTGYFLVNRVGFSIQVLRELYAETNQILLLGRIRFGGILAEPWKMKVQRVHA